MTDEKDRAREQARSQLAGIIEMLDALDAAGDNESSHEEALQRIYEHPLCVEFRSDWVTSREECGEATEYRIVLCTGGPHCEIQGRLDRHGEPESARLLFNDWFRGLEELVLDTVEYSALERYASIIIPS